MAAASLAAGCSPGSGPPPGPAAALPSVPSVSPISVDGGWVYQLQGYPDGRLDELIRAPQRIAVIDLARDAGSDFFTAEEVGALRGSGKAVLAYFEIGSIESFRPEYPVLRDQDPNLMLNAWPDWPDEYFVRYWDQRWWEVVRGRVDRALRAGFDGVYLDTPLAYEELDLSLVDGQSRESLAEAMVALIVRTSRYAKAYSDGFLIVPQNSPELRAYPDYTTAIDGIGMEELFVRATNQPCAEEYCAENLANTRALRDAGKFVLAVDYATRAGLVAQTCAQYRTERFAGYVGVRELDRVSAACS
jgi:cysteinyl-tRNA synthetase